MQGVTKRTRSVKDADETTACVLVIRSYFTLPIAWVRTAKSNRAHDVTAESSLLAFPNAGVAVGSALSQLNGSRIVGNPQTTAVGRSKQGIDKRRCGGLG